MWFPEIFERIKVGKAGCGGVVPHPVDANFTVVDNRTCLEIVAQENEIYFQSFLVAMSNLPGNLVTYLVIDRLGRRRLLGKNLHIITIIKICGLGVAILHTNLTFMSQNKQGIF